jgi:hypothetical protein
MAIRIERLIGHTTILARFRGFLAPSAKAVSMIALPGGPRGVWIVAGVLTLPCLAPPTVSAQQWHELYASGVAALRQREAQKAVELLRRAIQKRPQPGVRVPTYGTNFEPQYFPYLRLAEAHLLLGAAEDAATALQTSARFAVEPEDERTVLEARAEALLEAKRPPPEPTPDPTPPPTPAPVAAAEVPPDRPGDAVPPPEPRSVAPEPAPAPPSLAPALESPRPQAAAPASASAVTTGGLSGLDITSDPPGAQVFLDDETVGHTDPETGRLRLRELAPGRYRLRLSSEGRADLIREIDIAGESVAVEAVLPPRPAAPSPGPPSTEPRPRAPVPVGAVVAVGVLAVLVVGLWVWRQARPPSEPVAAGGTPGSEEGRRDSGTDKHFPMPFGGYTLVRRIGKGGMAVVYEATRRGESFALKRPLAGFLDDDRYRERFVREADLGRTLHHPNIIRIFDRGQVGDIPYFVMELVRGETLRARLEREGRLDAKLSARVTAQVAEALDYAHNKGVIHRDLKPSNIMLDQSGGVKVMDYGVARAERLQGLTTTGSFLGSPSYAAPETVDAGAQPQSDVYSLGVVFFEMLTGSLPFHGETAFAVLRRHATAPPPAPSSLNYAIPATLDRLVLRLLSKEAAERPTAEDLLNEIADFLGADR